ncbi:MAG: hypothetical protein E7485_04580 [Ruminococcaceae bacterium]|nr:hypothetical protein [Oscillospiraceae bacterium]
MSEHIGYARVDDRYGFCAKGTFRCPRKKEPLMLAIAAAVYTACLLITIVNAVIVLTSDLSMPIFEYDKTIDDFVPTIDLFGVIVSVLLVVILTAAVILSVIIITNGKEYTYFADEIKMVITDPDGEKTVFEYKDMVSVTYEKLTLFKRRQRGFDVYIETKYRTHNYQYIYSENKLLRSEKDTPFFILEERAGLKKRRYNDDMGA